MARHRGAFKPNNPAPFELSRSKVETFISCKGCFWLDRVAGIKPPEMPSFTINTTTDILLKRDADAVRGQATLPLWEANGLGHLIPFEHEHLENWTNSMHFGQNETFFNADHPESNIRFGGGLDDVFLNTQTGQLHIVDYKSTAQGTRSPNNYEKKPVSLDDPWKKAYKRQMDMYVWVLNNKGFDVSNTGYFVYVDAQHKDIMGMLTDARDAGRAWMQFDASIIAYEADPSWVGQTLCDIKQFVTEQKTCPAHTPKGDNYSGCDLGRYLDQTLTALGHK
ncbi:PD-(D/E)XK nuclease family protein [Luminiphilus sp.]|nr:PD-(D/E)XK nuclease family protein [Luminiphilus sp.]